MKFIDKIKDTIFKIKDYDRLESDYCTALCYFTNNRMSKPNYKIDVVEEVIGDAIGEYMDEGYKQAEQDIMEKFKMWVAHNGYTAQESELVYNDFKQFITEN